MDYTEKYTAEQLEALEKRIEEVYRQAERELDKKRRAYFKQYQKRYKTQYEAYQNGVYTKSQFMAWKVSQLGRGKRWEAMRDDMAQRLLEANEIAASYINDTAARIYTEAHNFEAYYIDKATTIMKKPRKIYGNSAWNLVNEEAVKRMILDDMYLFPVNKAGVNPLVDLAYNRQKLQNILLQNTLTGGDIYQLAKQFQKVTEMNWKSAVRNARTASGMAMNSGKLDAMMQSKARGLDLKKKWIAGRDNRTRDSHKELNGVTVEVEDKFPNGLMKPCDSDGPAEEVYNCRCRMISIFEGINDHIQRGNTVESYEAWKEEQLSKRKPMTFTDATSRAIESKER